MNRSLLLAAALATSLAAGCAATGDTGTPPTDESELAEMIRQELALDPLLNSSQVTVVEDDGRVVISGFANSVEDINTIRDVVDGVDGVVEVENNVVVQGDG